MRVTASHTISGTFLPKACVFAQDTAEDDVVSQRGLVNSLVIDNVETVVVAPPQGAKAQSLIRYPSPCRRSCAFMRGPSLFSYFTMGCGNQRRLAHKRVLRICDLEKATQMALNGSTTSSHFSKGTETCTHLPSRDLPSSVFWALRPAGEPFPNRRYLARARGLAPPQCWTAALPPVRLSALRATWRTAKPTRIAATEFKSRRNPARTSNYRTIDAARVGGLFMPCRRGNAPGQEPKEGT